MDYMEVNNEQGQLSGRFKRNSFYFRSEETIQRLAYGPSLSSGCFVCLAYSSFNFFFNRRISSA